MTDAYAFLYNGALIVIGVLLLFCLIRAIRGPRIADRVISINMMGTLIVITICVLAFLMNEGYLVDIAMIYTMLSFLAVVLLTKIYMGVYREKCRRREAAENQAKEDEAHEKTDSIAGADADDGAVHFAGAGGGGALEAAGCCLFHAGRGERLCAPLQRNNRR